MRRTTVERERRGFTLMELMVVIVIIGILAVMAIPSMSIATFDRDTYNDAGAIMQLFRAARTRAIARGNAVVVQMTTASPNTRGAFFTYEAPSSVAGGLPTASCKYPTTWALSTLTPIDSYALGTAAGAVEVLANITATPYAYTSSVTTGASFTEGYVCYTPLGRSYVTLAPAVAGAPLLQTSGVPVFSGLSAVTALEIKVTRADGPTIRSVLIPNNGMARLFSHTQ